ncbi:MAG: J domain-containing protein [Chloroflexi bacterium]|nr:MAG: J domain-containing protein [Chloroflexota bacterium]
MPAVAGVLLISTVNRNRANFCLSCTWVWANLPADADFYRVLQVDPSADPDVIEAAYKRLAFKFHPDHNRGDSLAEEHMKRINEAFRVLGRPDLRADYDARSGARLPELTITPAEIVIRAFDPAAREINFSVRLTQAGGPSFDPSVHRIDLALAPPWHQAEVHWHWSDDSLPADVDFTLAFPDGVLESGTTLSGNIELTVTARE